MNNDRAIVRITRILNNLRSHHYDLRLVNVSPIRGDHYQDILTDPDTRVSYGDCRNYDGNYSALTWDRVAVMLAENSNDEWNCPAIEIPYSFYSDYSGSVMERANHDSLMGDSVDPEWPSHAWTVRPALRDVYGDMGTTGVIMPLALLTDPAFRGPWVPTLYQLLDSLADYPVLDESLMGEIEMTIIDEAIDSYGLFDVQRAAVAIVEGAWSDDNDSAENALALDLAIDADTEGYGAWFRDQLSHSDTWPEVEDAVGSVAWNGQDDAMARVIADTWVASRALPWAAVSAE